MQRAKTKDYTTGNLSGHFIMLALPLIAGNILQQLYNTIDAFVIGRFASSEEFAAIGVASSIMNLFLFAVIGCCTGVSILLAQSYGAGEMKQFRQYHFLATVAGLFMSVMLGFGGILLMNPLLRAIQTPEALTGFVKSYLYVILGGFFISFLYNLYAALLRSVGRARIALLALAIAVVVNMGLDVFFVRYLHMGIRGTGIATVAAQGISVLFCVIYLSIRGREFCFEKEDCRLERKPLKKLVTISLVTGVHQISLYVGKLFVQGSVNTAGTEMIAAYSATTRIEGFANSFGDSGSAATAILVAQNYGAGKTERVKKSFRISAGILIIFGLISAAVMYTTAEYTVGFLLGRSVGVDFINACMYMRRIALFYVFCFTGNTFAGYFEGIGRVQIPFIGALSHITMRVILSYLWISRMGLSAVAFATGIGWIFVNLLWGFIKYKIDRAENQKARSISMKSVHIH